MATKTKEIKTKFYVSKAAVGPNEKCPPQAKLILDTITAAGGKIERSELITLLSRPPAEGGLTTNQTPERILGFYKPKLVESGFLEELTETSTIEIEVPDKPVKEETPAAPAVEGEAVGVVPGAKVKGAKGKKVEAAA